MKDFIRRQWMRSLEEGVSPLAQSNDLMVMGSPSSAVEEQELNQQARSLNIGDFQLNSVMQL